MPPAGIPPPRRPESGDLFSVAFVLDTPGGGLALILIRQEDDTVGLRTICVVHIEAFHSAIIFGPLAGQRTPSIRFPLSLSREE